MVAVYYSIMDLWRVQERLQRGDFVKKLWKLLIDRQVQRKLAGFHFTRSRNYNLSAKRLKAQEAFRLWRTTKLRKIS